MFRLFIVFTVFASFSCSGCTGGRHQQTGALLGTGLGALTGAMIGQQSGHAEGGAVIGGVIGGLTGSMAGQAEDFHEQQDYAIQQASQQQFTANALSNNDITMMSLNQVGDQVIVNSIKTQGGLFDLSPEGIIALKQQGVSDQVIQAMQDSTRSPRVSVAPPVRSSSTQVYVTPGIAVNPYYSYYDHHRHHAPPYRRSGIHIHGQF